MSWKERLFATGTAARAGRPHPAEADAEAPLEGVLGFITAVYGVALTPSDPSVLNRLAGRRSAVIEGATLEQLVRSAGLATAETCQMLIDHLPFAVVIADATGLVLLAIDPALHALRLGEIIASSDGRIHVADPVASDRLQAAIARACAPRESDPPPVLISVTPEAPWRQVLVMRITRGLDARYAALLFPVSRRLNGAARILASLFSFTAAEARMAVLVLEGRTLAQAACVLGVRTRTALETWKNVRLKLRTRTDSDCLRVLCAALLITESAASPPH
jgi:DNA-binding CsgD family transcriptional regulator